MITFVSLPSLDLPTFEKLLTLGIVLIVAALIGGGVDAAGIVKLPAFRDWRVQSALGGFGAIVVAFALASMDATIRNIDTSAFLTHLSALQQGAAGLPPPTWPVTLVKDRLEDLSTEAGQDPTRNCQIASFIQVHDVALPLSIKLNLRSAAKGSASQALACYQAIIDNAAKSASAHAAEMRAGLVEPAADAHTAVADSDSLAAFGMAVALRVGGSAGPQAQEIAPASPATNILEAIAAPGQRGWIYLGRNDSRTLGDQRTIAQTSAVAGQSITLKVALNLHEVGTDTNYPSHRVECVIPAGSDLFVESVMSGGNDALWARVRILHLG